MKTQQDSDAAKEHSALCQHSVAVPLCGQQVSLSLQAMRFPPKAYNKDLESAEVMQRTLFEKL